MENENQAKVSHICRACSQSTDTPATLFDLKYNQLNLSDMFELCTSVQLQTENNVSAYMCETCVAYLIATHCFIKQCQSTDSKLRDQNSANGLHTAVEVKQEQDCVPIAADKSVVASDISNLKLECKYIEIHNENEVSEQDEVNVAPSYTYIHPTPLSACGSGIGENKMVKTRISQDTDDFPSNMAQNQIEHQPHFQSTTSIPSSHINTQVNNETYNNPDKNCTEDTKKQRKVQCKVCSREVRDSSLKIHMMIHTGETPYMCDLCGKCFRQTSVLRQHKRTHTGERPYVCEFCHKNFRSASSFKWHIAIHKAPEHPVPCGTCDKVLRSQEAWRRHQLVHTKPFECNECGKGFVNKTQLREHIAKHQGLKPHNCHICHQGFCRKSRLKMHLFKHQEVKAM